MQLPGVSIKPPPHTRLPDTLDSNIITDGADGMTRFIAHQAPSPSQRNTYFSMMFAQDVDMVIHMHTSVWPDLTPGQTHKAGDFTITALSAKDVGLPQQPAQLRETLYQLTNGIYGDLWVGSETTKPFRDVTVVGA